MSCDASTFREATLGRCENTPGVVGLLVIVQTSADVAPNGDTRNHTRGLGEYHPHSSRWPRKTMREVGSCPQRGCCWVAGGQCPLSGGCGRLVSTGKFQPEAGHHGLLTESELPTVPSCQNCPGVGLLHNSTSNGK